MPRILVATCAVALVLGACSGDKKKASPPTTVAPVGTTVAPTSAPTSAPHPTDVFPTESLPCQPLPTPSTPVTSPAPAQSVYLTAVDRRGDRCVDHVIFSFS